MLQSAESELGSIASYAGFGVFGGDRIAVARATLPGASIFGFDDFAPFESTAGSDTYRSNLNCPLELTIRNLARRGIDAHNPTERITFAGFESSDGWPGQMMQLLVIDRSFSDRIGHVLTHIEPLLTDHAVLLYDGWTAEVSDSHHGWVDQNQSWASNTFCTFQTTGRAFVLRRRP